MIAVAILLPVAFIVIGCCIWFEKTYRDTLRRLWGQSQPTCSAMHAACHYEGWYGSVHSFSFYNHDFAKAFRQAKAGKCLDAPL
jgi:hypothetical protein